MMRAMEDDPKIEWIDPDSVTISTRDAEELREQLETWLTAAQR